MSLRDIGKMLRDESYAVIPRLELNALREAAELRDELIRLLGEGRELEKECVRLLKENKDLTELLARAVKNRKNNYPE